MSKECYLKSIDSAFSRLAAWLPDQRLQLGDVGLIHHGEFRLMTTLSDLGIEFKVRTGPASRVDHQHGVSVSFEAEGHAEGPEVPNVAAKAKASIQFGKGEGFVMRGRDCVEDVIANLDAVQADVLDLYRDSKWKEEYVFVHLVRRAASATFILSKSAKASVEIEASGAVSAQGFDLADAGLGLHFSRQSGDFTMFLCQAETTPLYLASRVRGKMFWRKPSVEIYSFGGDDMVNVSVEDAMESEPKVG